MPRLEKILTNTDYKEYLKKIETLEKDRKFCRHDAQHFWDVARITYILFLESGQIEVFMAENDFNLRLAREIIYAAAILHDVGRWKQYETGEDHALVSARLAPNILADAGFTRHEIGIITRAIREHRLQGEDSSLLGRFLYRGDKLSRRCFECLAVQECHWSDRLEAIDRIVRY